MTKNIFQIVSDKTWKGPEQYVYDLVKVMKESGQYVEIVCRKKEAVIARFRQLELPISILPLKGVTDIDSANRFSRLIKRGHNIVHVHCFRDAFTALIAKHIAENKNTKIVMTCHTVAKSKGDFMHKRLYNEIDKIIFVSDMARKEFLSGKAKIDEKKTVVVHNSVQPSQNRANAFDVRKKYGIEPTKCLIMFHGKISEEKGVPVLLRALTQIDKEKFHLIIAGEGEMKEVAKIKAFIVANQLVQNVTFLGFQEDVQSLIAQCDFGVLPSVWREPFGLTNLEYMMLGKAHIATKNGAQSEYVKDGETGILVEPDNFAQLAEAISMLIDDVPKRTGIGTKAQAYFYKHLSYAHFYETITSIYKSL
jgi:glycosyltransferase involved in cell wall biosynthesis